MDSENYEDMWYRYKKAYVAIASSAMGDQNQGRPLPDF